MDVRRVKPAVVPLRTEFAPAAENPQQNARARRNKKAPDNVQILYGRKIIVPINAAGTKHGGG